MTKIEIGCCGAYCGSCRVFGAPCKGCKIGYASGERDITRARCAMKVCCVSKGFASCADCPEVETCETLAGFHGKTGYKYAKYRQAIVYIRAHGYDAFLAVADGWTNAHGRYR